MSRINVSKEQWVDILRRSTKIVQVGESMLEGWYRISKVYFRNPDTKLVQIGVVMTTWIEDANYLLREDELLNNPARYVEEELDPDY